MIDIDIPGYGRLQLEHLVLDYNGTLAIDGETIEGVLERLDHLSQSLTVHVVTADTFGKVKSCLTGIPCQISVLPLDNQAEGKRDYIQNLGVDVTVCVGNGRNDRLMLQAASLGIAVIQKEGAAYDAISHATVVCPHPYCPHWIFSPILFVLSPLYVADFLRVLTKKENSYGHWKGRLGGN